MMAKGQFRQAYVLLCALSLTSGYALQAIAAIPTDDKLVDGGNLLNSNEVVDDVLAPSTLHRLEGVVDVIKHVACLGQIIEIHLSVIGMDHVRDVPDSRASSFVPTASMPGLIGRMARVLTRCAMPICLA